MRIKGVWGDQIRPRLDQHGHAFQYMGVCLIETETGKTVQISVEDTSMGGMVRQQIVVLYHEKQWTIILDDIDPKKETSAEEGRRIFGEIADEVGTKNPGLAITAAVKAVKAISELNYEIRS